MSFMSLCEMFLRGMFVMWNVCYVVCGVYYGELRLNKVSEVDHFFVLEQILGT